MPQPLDGRPVGQRYTGILRGGNVAVGAETTGWVLEQEGNVRLDVNVSKVRDDAAKLDGRRVVIDGTVVTANWTERGKKRLLMADRIAPVDDGK